MTIIRHVWRMQERGKWAIQKALCAILQGDAFFLRKICIYQNIFVPLRLILYNRLYKICLSLYDISYRKGRIRNLADDIDYPIGNKLPLWIIGFLY